MRLTGLHKTLIVRTDQGSKGQGHLLSCSGQLKSQVPELGPLCVVCPSLKRLPSYKQSVGQQIEQQKILQCCGQYMVAIMLNDQYLFT